MKLNLTIKGIIRRGGGKILIVKRSASDNHRPGIWETVGGMAYLIESEEDIKLVDEHTRLGWINEDEIDQHEFVWPAMSRMIKNGFRRRRCKIGGQGLDPSIIYANI